MNSKQFLSQEFIQLDSKEKNDLPYSPLSADQKKNIVLGFVIRRIAKSGKCCANSEEFQAECGIARSTLHQVLKRLKEEGLIEILNYFEEEKIGETREIRLAAKLKEQLRRLVE
jgi:DNA-binding transcriptional ArsR family regulator